MKQDAATRRVYRWEEQWASWNTGSLKLKQMRELVTWALGAYKIPHIPVRSHNGRDMSFYLASDAHPMISFNKEHHNAAIGLHEAAHHITDTLYGRDLAEHCPEWLGIYLWLMTEANIAPRVALESSAKAMGLKWRKRSSPKAVPRYKQ